MTHPSFSLSRDATPAAILVGTARSIRQMVRLLQEVQHAPRPVAWVILDSSSSAAQVPDPPVATAAGPKVYYGLAGLAEAADSEQVHLALVSLPLDQHHLRKQVTDALEQRNLPWRYIPTSEDLLSGRISPESLIARQERGCAAESACGSSGRAIHIRGPLWSVDPEKLLGRKPRKLDEEAIRQVLCDKVVMITGAGGSIGSELARVAARFGPRRLILVERSENALFEIDRELGERMPHVDRAAVLHDVTDAARTLAVVMAYRPDIIFHAAAHKHVPMMEDHPAQAVENNFYGTRSIADAAARVGVGRFVMISTDKAVRPSSVMGATKRLAELYVQYLSERSDTLFAMVRFGNVLGSACSVLPIWADQLARGRRITVTHPAMTRYFMTIPEAAGLVIQSAAYAGLAGGGEVFLLDMGQPIRIVELARRFIRSHGLEPGVDVQIEFTGIRPGEKLFEELAYDDEEMIPTPHPSVRIWRTQKPDPQWMQRIIAKFDALRGQSDGRERHFWQGVDRQTILAALREAVPEMTPSAASASAPPLAAAG